jgi:hypothetical protein
MSHKVTGVFEEKFYGSSLLHQFVCEAISERDQDRFSAVIVIDKDFDDEWQCKATVSYTK